MKYIIMGVLLALTSTSYALRCGNDLIYVGDSYRDVQSCNIVDEYQVQSDISDIRLVYIKKAGMTYIITVVDGRVNDITYNRR